VKPLFFGILTFIFIILLTESLIFLQKSTEDTRSSKRWSYPYTCHEGVWRVWVTAPLIINIDAKWRWV